MESALRNFIISDTAVAALVGSRMYPGRLPQAATFPAITYSTVSVVRGHNMQGPEGMPFTRLQLDMWGESFSDARAVAEAVRLRLDGFAGDIGSPPSVTIVGAFYETERTEGFEPEPDLYRISVDYQIVSRETP